MMGTTEQALLTNNNPEPYFRHRPSESTTLPTRLIMYCPLFVSSSDWLHIFLACHWITDRQELAEASVVQYVCALVRRHCTFWPHGMVKKRMRQNGFFK
uniref:ULP_PROTEASE domain-containing protein n=1 Tax=Mesocestoides corti TaxID=53468 RepID=A0A5K3F3A6_MESCO